MKPEDISKIIEKYKTQKLDCNPIFASSNSDIIELIDYYFASRYVGGDYDSSGYKKAFYNIVINPTEIASKMIDLDTKDIRVVAEDGQSYYPAWFFGRELKIWMKDKKNHNGQTFGQLLNQMVYTLPKYGHLIAKKAKDTVHIVPIQNMYCDDPEGKNFLTSDILIEEHKYTPDQLRKTGWRDVEGVIAKFTEDGLIKVFEIHYNTDKKNNYIIIPDKAQDDEYLYRGTVKREDLYKELKWEDIPGRVLGRGQVEKLFEAQIAKNYNEHLLRGGYRWTSKKLWQTRDDQVAKNLITELEDGDVLTVNSEITPISMEERNLGAINLGDSKWDSLIARLSFSAEPMSGERPPAGTPLGTSILQTRMAGQFYDLKREELGMFIKDILTDWIIPEFKKQKKSVHKVMLGEFDEDELTRIRELILTHKSNQDLLKYVERNKTIPSAKEMEMFKVISKEQISRQKDLEIPAKFYDHLKYKIDIVITNEQIDMASRMTTLQTILQIIGSNPTILQDPKTKKIFYKLLDLAGISPTDFRDDEQGMEQMVQNVTAERGGSIARVPSVGTPQETTAATTI